MAEPVRSHLDGVLLSTALPPLRLEVDPSLRYLGATEVVIKNLARAERHYFVDSRDGEVRRMLVAQFEGFLPTNDERYRYPLPDPVLMGGETWGSWVFAYSVDRSESAETADTIGFLAGHGLALPDEQLMARYARILEPDARHEVLVFYNEPLRRLGHTLGTIAIDGELRPDYASVATELKARARRAFNVLRADS